MLRSLWKQLQKLSNEAKLGALTALLLGFSYTPALVFSLQGSDVQLSFGLMAFASLAIVLVVLTLKHSTLVIYKPLLPVLIFLSSHLVFNWHGPRSLFLYLIWGAILTIALSKTSKQFVTGLLYGMVGGAVLFSLVGVYQLFGDAYGFATILRPEYSGNIFGFARPQAFFEEPQFLASYLAMALFAALYVKVAYRRFVLAVLVFGIALTMSRGAALAAAVAFALYSLNLRSLRMALENSIVLALGVLAAIVMIGFAGWIRSDYTVEPRYFQSNYLRNMVGASVDTSRVVQLDTKKLPIVPVAESSASSRLTSSRQALDIATQSSGGFLFGRGFASFNDYQTNRYGATPSRAGYTVNNFYIETLFEFGLVGMLAIITWMCAVVVRLVRIKTQITYALAFMLVAGMVQQLFFSSIVNNLHFWVVLACATSFALHSSGRAPRKKKA